MIGEELALAIREGASRLGYTDCGICAADRFAGFNESLDAVIESFPELSHLYEPMRGRADPVQRAPWARSIVVCLRRYGKYRLPQGAVGHIGRNYLCDRRYDRNPDHAMTSEMTAHLKSLGLRVAKGGVSDRWAAVRAGVATIGKNCFAFSKRHGSWVNIECWLVDAELPYAVPTIECECPQGCRACLDACPTGAIVEPFLMRMDRCIAWLTYHAPEPIDPAIEDAMGEWVYGCDACQQVCPRNKDKWEDAEEMPWMDEAAGTLNPAGLAAMDDARYRNEIHPRFWYISKDNPDRWRRNARRALRNRARRADSSLGQ